MPAHRNPRRRKRNAATLGLVTAYRAPVAAGIALDTNPNRGKHGAARLDVLGERESARIVAAARDYRPLTVETPLRDSLGRRSRAKSRYTI